MPALPTELEQMIFVTAALDYPLSAPKLALVARRTQLWVEPLVYEAIIVQHPSNTSRKATVDGFLYAISRKPADFFARHVKILILSYLKQSQITRILSVCTGVVSLGCWTGCNAQLGRFIARSPLRPRRLSTCLENTMAMNEDPDFGSPFYRNVTHLELDDSWSRWMTWAPAFALLPRLTHLALSFTFPVQIGNMLLDALRQILGGCKTLELCVLFLAAGSGQKWYQSSNSLFVEKVIRDPRVVMMPWSLSHVRWASECWGSWSMWSCAGAIALRQRELYARGEYVQLSAF
ncbi:hypothetical protein SERLADRAFT_409958 [Serpula lacrymans var. lacrymans S7.9]|uniref:F-box domain-containing protein n=1 Tax=Serpula lacrymans var. lacrymans (strain S7.9) TaxID=578457 RepID=F8P2T4_SERL9|nr:uncharacterized protein SERLADRAFT_409958 [Serpula lacrymans var. lacrymans S7.9]EGO22469.1 hypothetical protein SERLADRAFT_409958 [Serpula lacrymans var. lacrymans S7.9]